MSRIGDIQETADDLNERPMAAGEDKTTEADEIGWAAQNILKEGQGEAALISSHAICCEFSVSSPEVLVRVLEK